ncbi:MAG: KUP/HAK/KT family potassium transporter [Verrucomicrobia bacterium]|nr:KUP/HAK/KT family potassium transporter [Verrucomicrobiota bacterium]
MSEHKSSNSWSLALVALGVVFGDIGTSPLYALKECLHHAKPTPGDPLGVLGPLSLMFWSLIVMVCFKYLGFITRATNQGEGGMFALLTLFRSAKRGFKPQTTGAIVLIGIFGACLLYGDGMITPAISVLSAVEGLALLDAKLGTDLSHYVVPISAVIIMGLFLVQRHGTATIGKAFGPIMVLWFLTLAILGIINISSYPGVFSAISPHHGINFLMHHGHDSFVLMGLVLLAVTGCEAMYADIGHFGRPPLVRSWYVIVLPALMLNYLGQGALVLSDVNASLQPGYHHFFSLVPQVALIPVILLATAATIIASQAMITGVYSLTQQAVQLGYLPRLKIIHTNPDVRGQIYMPQVNYLLMVCCLALVFHFKSSTNLAAAYGLSVALDMTFTSLLFFLVAREVWQWPLWKAGIPVIIFLIPEIGYVSGSLQAMQRGRLPVQFLVDEIGKDRIIRVPGAAVFMSASADGLPLALLHHLKHNKALHKQVILLTVRFEDSPYVCDETRHTVEEHCDDFYRVVLRYGFAESPQVFDDLVQALEGKTKLNKNGITFYQSREVLLTNGPGKMALWRKKLFVMLSRLSRPATGYFDLPPRQVCELGIQLEV